MPSDSFYKLFGTLKLLIAVSVCLSPLEPGSGRHGQSHSHRISSVDGGKGTEAGQPSDVCEIIIHGVTFHKTVKPRNFIESKKLVRSHKN